MKAKLIKAIDEIEAIKETLISDYEQLTENQLTFKPKSKKWNLLQVAEHLMLAETGSINYVNKKIKGIESLEEYSFKAGFRFWVMKCFLNAPIKIRNRAPAAAPTLTPAFDNIKLRWNIAREALKKFTATYDDETLNKLIYKHPLAGRLNILQMVNFFKLHLNHHMKQIKRIKQHKNFPDS